MSAGTSADEASDPRERRVLVLAPRGRDAEVVAHVLKQAGFDTFTCTGLDHLAACLAEGAGLAFITEESLSQIDPEPVRRWLGHQEPWSDLPLVVLATRQAARRSAAAKATLDDLGNVVLLERPLNVDTLVSAARAALRSRQRQYHARRQFEAQARVSRENERLYESVVAAERSAREQAEHASRVKDEFLATLSHELRTPLSAILGWVYVLKRQWAHAPEAAKGVEAIERNARSQARLIDELLDMSRILAGTIRLERRALMPGSVVDSAVASLQPMADSKSIEITREVSGDAGPVDADPDRLQQVVWNLLANAIKFTPEGGHVRVSLQREGPHVALCVEDDGQGIAASFLPHLFQRFRQADSSTRRSHGGLGLGLAIVRHLVELHGGSVQVSSDGVGHGARFCVRLPVLQGTAAPAEPAVSTATAPERRDDPGARDLAGVKILLVDDEADGRDVIARILAQSGAAIVTAASADEAMARLEDAQADILISDIGMPQVDGYALLQRLRTRGWRLPAIALTAFARNEDKSKASAAGYSMHLAKPVEPDVLVSSVTQLLGKT